jgi:hypothetical protein
VEKLFEGDFSDDVLRGVRLAIYSVSGELRLCARRVAASSRAERTTGQHYVRDPDLLPPPSNPVRRAFRMGSELTSV